MQSTTAAGHRKYVINLSRNMCLIVGDLLVGIIRVEETVLVLLLVAAFTTGGEISFGWGN